MATNQDGYTPANDMRILWQVLTLIFGFLGVGLTLLGVLFGMVMWSLAEEEEYFGLGGGFGVVDGIIPLLVCLGFGVPFLIITRIFQAQLIHCKESDWVK